MQDLDLDELDQAVNNIMTKPKGRRGAKKPASVAAEPVESRFDSVAVTSRPASQADSVLSTPGPGKSSEESPATPPPRASDSMRVIVNRPMPKVPERRRMHPGAMDIIQPSTLPKVNAPSNRPSHLAAALQPAQAVTPPVSPVAAPMPKPEQTSETQPERRLDTPQDVSDEVLASLSLLDEKKPNTDFLAPEKKFANPMLDVPEPKPAIASIESVAPAKKLNDGWPDPLDFHDFGDSSSEVTPAAGMPAEPTVSDEPKETPPSIAAEPVSVTDSHDDAATASSSPFVMTKVEKRPLGAFAGVPPQPAKVALPESADAPVPHESTSKGELAEASLESKQHLGTPQNNDDFDPTDLRSMTIPPQYHAAEQKPADGMRPVFDTKEYHAAPPHMYAPRKGGPALVIGVVVLIVLILAAVLVGYLMMTGTFSYSFSQHSLA